jgi:hypothetical protein
MGMAVFLVASLLVFSRRFFSVLKINFVTKSDKVQIYKKHHITHFLHKAKSKGKNILRVVRF